MFIFRNLKCQGGSWEETGGSTQVSGDLEKYSHQPAKHFNTPTRTQVTLCELLIFLSLIPMEEHHNSDSLYTFKEPEPSLNHVRRAAIP